MEAGSQATNEAAARPVPPPKKRRLGRLFKRKRRRTVEEERGPEEEEDLAAHRHTVSQRRRLSAYASGWLLRRAAVLARIAVSWYLGYRVAKWRVAVPLCAALSHWLLERYSSWMLLVGFFCLAWLRLTEENDESCGANVVALCALCGSLVLFPLWLLALNAEGGLGAALATATLASAPLRGRPALLVVALSLSLAVWTAPLAQRLVRLVRGSEWIARGEWNDVDVTLAAWSRRRVPEIPEEAPAADDTTPRESQEASAPLTLDTTRGGPSPSSRELLNGGAGHSSRRLENRRAESFFALNTTPSSSRRRGQQQSLISQYEPRRRRS